MLRVLASLPSCIIETSMGLGLNGAVELPNRNVRKSSRRVHVSVQVSSLKKTVLRNKPLPISHSTGPASLHLVSRRQVRSLVPCARNYSLMDCTNIAHFIIHQTSSCSLLRPLIRHVVSSSTNHAAPSPPV